MKLIRNISPMGISVNISVIDDNGQTISIELKYGENILVNNGGVETKSIIIQNKKGNIDIIDTQNTNNLNLYQVYEKDFQPVVEIVIPELTIETSNAPEIISILDDMIESTNEIEKNWAEAKSVLDDMLESTNEIAKIGAETIIKNKGGRPKGSFKKKSKSKTKKKKNKNKKLPNNKLGNTES